MKAEEEKKNAASKTDDKTTETIEMEQ